MTGKWSFISLVLLVLVIANAPLANVGHVPATAAEPTTPASPTTPPSPTILYWSSAKGPPKQETWVGSQVIGDSWVVYTGTTLALYGGLHKPGWRLRLIGGHGNYDYFSDRSSGGVQRDVQFIGQYEFSDLLFGYQGHDQDLSWQAFIGVVGARQSVTPFDADNQAIGEQYGGQASIEAWYTINRQFWLSAEAKYVTVFNGFGASLRGGYRINQNLSVGLEAGTAGNDDYVSGRAALFGAYTFGLFSPNDGYSRLSIGASGDRRSDLKPYVSVSFSLKH